MQYRVVLPDVVTYNSTINAASKGRQSQQALSLFEEMQPRNVTPNAVCYRTTIYACEKGNLQADAQRLGKESERRGARWRDHWSS